MKTVFLTDCGILPNTDITSSLSALLSENTSDTEFVFESADYYFSPKDAVLADFRISNSDVMPHRVLAILLKNMKNCRLSGNGARLWLSGQMQVFTLDHCENVTIDNFVVNWKKPLVAEGRVVARSGAHVDVFVDNDAFPHKFEDGKLWFDTGADQFYPYSRRAIVFEPHSLRARKNVSDVSFESTIIPVGDSTYRMRLKRDADVRVGDLLNMRHNARIHAGIFSEKCSDITVQNVTFHSCGGLGCLSQFCHNMTYRAVHFLPDKSLSRYVSCGRDDGMHITCNSGTVTVTECSFHALMDDPINVHGCCVTSDEAVDKYTLRCKYRHPQACGFEYWAEAGDRVGFILRSTMQSLGALRVASYKLEDLMTFTLTFDCPIPDEILALANKGEALALDNLTHTAAFVCTKNRFGSCRARSVLISTPKSVRISENYFESSGSAILVAGDSNHWFESGECHDVVIENNVFTDACLGSDYQFCHGVISVCPVIPSPDVNKPYHKNISIKNNVFDSVGVPILYALSCENLSFEGNRIFKSPSSLTDADESAKIRLFYCNRVTVTSNQWIGDFLPVCVSQNECKNVKSDI